MLLVRHATTAATGQRLGGWTPGVHLDEAGVAQAEATAARLADLGVTAVYSSPLERTRDTADIVADAVGVEVVERRGLGETDYGDWTDRPLAELRTEPLWRVIQSTPSRATFPGGESLRGSQARMVGELEELAAAHGDRDVVVAVSHADPIKAAVAHFLGMPLDTFQRLSIAPASVTVVALPAGHAPAVLGVNLAGDITLPSPPTDDDASAAEGDEAGADEADGDQADDEADPTGGTDRP
nr:MSMEG_4193 family putative phosphomutase [Salsipaludibacter albus]